MPSAPSWKDGHADIRHRIQTSCGPRSCSMRLTGWATTRSPHAWTPRDRWYPSGANASTSSVCPDLPISPGEDDPPVFPPDVVVAVKALACELPTTAGAPLARWHCPDLARAARRARHRRGNLGHHHLALAVRGRDQTLAAPILDLPPRPRLRHQGRTRARPVRTPLQRRPTTARRVRDLRR